jgi:DNA-binding GntR family transcriptional regulator
VKIAQIFNVSEMIVAIAFSQLKKDGLIIIKNGVGSFVKFREGKGRARNSPVLFYFDNDLMVPTGFEPVLPT